MSMFMGLSPTTWRHGGAPRASHHSVAAHRCGGGRYPTHARALVPTNEGTRNAWDWGIMMPNTIVCPPAYTSRGHRQREGAFYDILQAPIASYEVRVGSGRRGPEGEQHTLSYRELAPKRVDQVGRVGFAHVEFLPVMEHPFSS